MTNMAGESPNPERKEILDSGETRGDIEDIVESLLGMDIKQFSTTELFDFSSRCVHVGYFDGRNSVYELIKNHPEASIDDIARIEINAADIIRREAGGEIKEERANQALEKLGEINLKESNPVTIAAYKQVYLLAKHLLHEVSSIKYPNALKELLLASKEQIDLTLNPSFPDNMRKFYMVGFLSMKGIAEEFDQDYGDIAQSYQEKYIDGADLTDEENVHVASQFYCKYALYFEHTEDINKALELNLLSYNVAQFPRYKVDGAVKALEILEKFPNGNLSGKTLQIEGQELVNYLLEIESELKADDEPLVLEVLDKGLAKASALNMI